jgi:hypothetical protein
MIIYPIGKFVLPYRGLAQRSASESGHFLPV